MTGVLSKLDAMDNELTVILSGVAIAKEINVHRHGSWLSSTYCEVLEQGNWTQLERLASGYVRKPAQLIEYYQQAQLGQSFAKT